MTASAQASATSREVDELIDVWTRTAPKYRRRAAVLLGVTILLFAGLCCFAFWLRTGLYGPWANGRHYMDLMWKSFTPRGMEQVTLVDFLLFPVSVEQVPIQSVIMGLLLASLSSIPILVAILYRFPASVIFAVMVSGLAAMPWLGLTVLLGCAIASLRPFRLNFRYASALLGLIPVAVYFLSATRQPAESLLLTTPYRAKLAAPWVLASLGSCVICAVALATAKLINYRPGGIAPLLAVLFAIPVVLFHTQVGRDELEYRILENSVGPGSREVFVNRWLGEEARQAATDAVARETNVDFEERLAHRLQEMRAAALASEIADCDRVIARCDEFIDRFRESRYIPNVYYLKGLAIDRRVDRALLDDEDALLQYYTDVPRPESRPIWKKLEDHFPSSELSAHALHQLARLAARDGDLDAALRFLHTLIRRFDRSEPTPRATLPQQATIFGKPPPSTSLGFDPNAELLPARRLSELIQTTRDDPRYGDRPLRELLALDPHDPLFVFNLGSIMLSYPDSVLDDSLAVRFAQATRTRSMSRTIDVLRAIASAKPPGRMQAEAQYALGQTLEDDGQIAESQAVFQELIAEHGGSCYATDARSRMSALALLAPPRGAGKN